MLTPGRRAPPMPSGGDRRDVDGEPGPRLDIAIEQEDLGLFLRDIDESNFGLFSGWIADYPDPQNFLDIKFHSQSANNEVGYSNSEVDDLLEEALKETDEAKTAEAVPGRRADHR